MNVHLHSFIPHSPFAIRHSFIRSFAIRYSPFAIHLSLLAVRLWPFIVHSSQFAVVPSRLKRTAPDMLPESRTLCRVGIFCMSGLCCWREFAGGCNPCSLLE